MRPGGRAAGVGDEDVHAPEVLLGRPDDARPLPRLGQVGGNREHLRPDLRCGRSEAVAVAGAERERRPFGSELGRDRPADPAARAADEGDLAVQPEVHLLRR